MQAFKSLSVKKQSKKQEREHRVLLKLVELYIQIGKPVGSATLRESGLEELSSATIHNYCMNLESQGYLTQQHSSGGRIPTDRAFRIFAAHHLAQMFDNDLAVEFQALREYEGKAVTMQVQFALELLSRLTGTAAFISSPRYDQDLILHMKIVSIDQHRCLCVVVTDFGVIKTELLQTEQKLSAFSLKRIEQYFYWRLTGKDLPDTLTEEETQLADIFYNEVMVRYLSNYAYFSEDEVFTTGFSQLLNYSDFDSAEALVSALALFEDKEELHRLLRLSDESRSISCWIGDDLKQYSKQGVNCAVIAMPYKVNQTVIGSVGLLGPMRLPYPELFRILESFSFVLSEALTKSVFKFQLNYRHKSEGKLFIAEDSEQLLLENKNPA